MENMLDFLISPAYAETTTAATDAAPQGGGFTFFIMFGIFFLFIYFGIWRPQNKRAKEQANMLNALAKGDEVITAGGILGRITKLNDAYITLTIGTNTDVVVQKNAIATVLPKGTMKTLE